MEWIIKFQEVNFVLIFSDLTRRKMFCNHVLINQRWCCLWCAVTSVNGLPIYLVVTSQQWLLYKHIELIAAITSVNQNQQLYNFLLELSYQSKNFQSSSLFWWCKCDEIMLINKQLWIQNFEKKGGRGGFFLGWGCGVCGAGEFVSPKKHLETDLWKLYIH